MKEEQEKAQDALRDAQSQIEIL